MLAGGGQGLSARCKLMSRPMRYMHWEACRTLAAHTAQRQLDSAIVEAESVEHGPDAALRTARQSACLGLGCNHQRTVQ